MRSETEKRQLMERALKLAEKGRETTLPNPMVGALIIKESKVVAEGHHAFFGGDHAEVMALKAAGSEAQGADMIVTLEPCSHWGKTPPCAEALVEAGIARVLLGALDPNPKVSGKGVARLRENGVEVETGVLSEAVASQNEAYWYWRKTGRPFAVLKVALSLDAKLGASKKARTTLTSEGSRNMVRSWRAEFGAVMVGIGTVLADDPLLSADARNAVRVVLDTDLRIPLESQIAQTAMEIPTIIACGEGADGQRALELEKKGMQVEMFPRVEGKVDIPGVMTFLGESHAAVLIEGGTGLNTCFVSEGLADKYLFFYAPMIVGGEEPPPFLDMKDHGEHKLDVRSVRETGEGDILVEAYPRSRNP